MPNFTKAIELIKASEKILILTHKNPDGDAVGSVLSLGLALDSLNKKNDIILKDKIPKVLEFLPEKEKIRYFEDLSESDLTDGKYDLVILSDCAELERTGVENIEEIIKPAKNLLIIDHHPEREIINTDFVHWVPTIYIWYFEISKGQLQKLIFNFSEINILW